MLLRSWIEDAGLSDRVAWVSIDRGERDAQRFWLSVVGSLRAVEQANDLFTRSDQPRISTARRGRPPGAPSSARSRDRSCS